MSHFFRDVIIFCGASRTVVVKLSVAVYCSRALIDVSAPQENEHTVSDVGYIYLR